MNKPRTPLANLDVSKFDQVYWVNVRGVVDKTRPALRLLRAFKGTVINILLAADARPTPGLSVYSWSKAVLSKAYAKELAVEEIWVIFVSEDPTEAPIYDKAGLSAEASQEHVDRVTKLVPLGRFGKADEVASVVAFPASAETSYVTGSEYAVDGVLFCTGRRVHQLRHPANGRCIPIPLRWLAPIYAQSNTAARLATM